MKYRNTGTKRIYTGTGWCMPGDVFETDVDLCKHAHLTLVKTRKKRKAKK